MTMRFRQVVLAVAVVTFSASVVAQVALDRVLSRVAGRPIMLSDVRQARALRLVPDTSSVTATLRGLEDRWLMLAEIEKAAPLPPVSETALEARLAEWRSATGGIDPSATPLPMSDAEIRAWLRDDLRIRAYLDRRFGMLPPPDGARARTDWLSRLRQRAELD